MTMAIWQFVVLIAVVITVNVVCIVFSTEKAVEKRMSSQFKQLKELFDRALMVGSSFDFTTPLNNLQAQHRTFVKQLDELRVIVEECRAGQKQLDKDFREMKEGKPVSWPPGR